MSRSCSWTKYIVASYDTLGRSAFDLKAHTRQTVLRCCKTSSTVSSLPREMARVPSPLSRRTPCRDLGGFAIPSVTRGSGGQSASCLMLGPVGSSSQTSATWFVIRGSRWFGSNSGNRTRRRLVEQGKLPSCC